MATLRTRCTHSDGVTLVELLATADRPERVRIENRLDGPVWPPRRRGVPAEGWTDEGFAGVVAPDDRLLLGYACPAEPADPPAAIAAEVPEAEAGDGSVTPLEVVRALGRAAPPHDAVPDPDGERGDTSVDETSSGDSTPGDPSAEPASSTGRSESLPPAVAEWLDAVAGRVDDAESLAAASSAGERTATVDAAGGPEAARSLREQLAAGRESLDRIAARSERLAARIEAVEVPAETVARPP